MSAKIDVTEVVRDHFETFHDLQGHQEDRVNLWDYVVQLGVPVALGAGTLLTGATIHALGALLAGAAILTAFSFGLAIFLFQARSEASDRYARGALTLRLLDEFFANVLYSVLIGLALTVVLMVCASLSTDPDHDSVTRAGAAVILTLGSHYLLVLLMCIKRLWATYRNLTR